jgi:hypothetical protein
MFYSGGDFEAVPAPPGLPGAAAGDAVEGLRMRPGLAMSQVCGGLANTWRKVFSWLQAVMGLRKFQLVGG